MLYSPFLCTVAVSDGPVLVYEGEDDQPELLAHVRRVHSEVILKVQENYIKCPGGALEFF